MSKLDTINYLNDPRVRALGHTAWFVAIGGGTEEPTHAVIEVPTADYDWLNANGFDPSDGDQRPEIHSSYEYAGPPCWCLGKVFRSQRHYPGYHLCNICDDTGRERILVRHDPPKLEEGAEDRVYRPFKHVVVPVRWDTCSLCQGKGTHVNPAIDAGGLTRADFDEDPDFEEAYFSGRFDVACAECGGKGQTPEVDYEAVHPEDKDAVQRWRKYRDERARDDAYYYAERMAEMRMGC